MFKERMLHRECEPVWSLGGFGGLDSRVHLAPSTGGTGLHWPGADILVAAQLGLLHMQTENLRSSKFVP